MNFTDRDIRKVILSLENSIRYYNNLKQELMSEMLKEEIDIMIDSIDETLKTLSK
ncbi:MAG: hypothetical protein KHZ90_08555 [Veillonella parvula]|uniref:Uncharacterized protein n=1 Tax=Veillonella parvula TaxID=29466 RepID=A0A942WSU4_VEIPA|nr:hypothetical protein [Veillonella parvula]MBS4893812.1 hypothetical protein [Veillonella parvula]